MQIKYYKDGDFSIPERWNVPRGTNEKLLIYVETVEKWNPSINLFSKNELQHMQHFWDRHVLDGLQLCQYVTNEKRVLDIGSGGGVPALMLAAAGRQVVAAESDGRKCEFLKEAARKMSVDVKVHHHRIETLTDGILGFKPNVISARALASISDSFEWTRSLQHDKLRYVLLKSEQYKKEIKEAQKNWSFEPEIVESDVTSGGYIVTLKNVKEKSDK